MRSINLYLLLLGLLPWAVFSQGVVFFVARTSNANAMSPLVFDHIGINVGGGFDPGTNSFTAPYTGTYMFSISAGAAAGQTLDMRIDGLNFPVAILRENVNTNGIDTQCRTVIISMTQGQKITVQTFTPTVSDPDGKLTSWSGIRLDSILDSEDPSAFSAHRNTGWSQQFFPINFTDVRVNVGLDYSVTIAAYESPRNGTVFITYSLGQESGHTTECVLLGDGLEYRFSRQDTTHGGIDMQSRHSMMFMIMAEYAYVNLLDGEVFSDATTNQISMSGFMYETADDKNVAWSVQRDRGLTAGDAPQPVDFQKVRMNEGGAFKGDVPGQHKVIIPTAGYYFIFLDLSSLWTPNDKKACDVDLMVNGAVAASVTRTSTIHSNTDPLGRAIILSLSVGDELTVVLNTFGGIHSDIYSQVSFTGFLVSGV